MRFHYQQIAGLIGAPAAWLAQMMLSEILSSHACYPETTPLSVPLMPWLQPVLTAISLSCLMAAFLSLRIAWNHGRHVTMDEGNTRFLALVSIYSSGLFLIATIFTACALLLVSPCRNWL